MQFLKHGRTPEQRFWPAVRNNFEFHFLPRRMKEKIAGLDAWVLFRSNVAISKPEPHDSYFSEKITRAFEDTVLAGKILRRLKNSHGIEKDDHIWFDAKDTYPDMVPDSEVNFRVRARMSKPKGDGPFPAIVFNIGFGTTTRDFKELSRLLSHLGYVVIGVDYRGVGKSGGRAEIARGEVQDSGKAIDFLCQQPYVDKCRIFSMGASMGGAVTLIQSAVDKRIAGAIALAPVTDFMGMFYYTELTDIPMLKGVGKYGRKAGINPEESPEELEKRSAISGYYLDKMRERKIPLLLLHGANDITSPAIQSVHYYEKLTKQFGYPEDLITLKLVRGRGVHLTIWDDSLKLSDDIRGLRHTLLEIFRFLEATRQC